MEIIFTQKALEDLQFWKKSGQKKIQNRITALLVAIKENPFEGVGKPEPLKHSLSGKWSRRIDQEHRLIYEIVNEQIIVYSLRYHY
ncbi:MAG: Txe/YoeB family addiction module toxin [Cyclobacteriaceae bacterium]